MKSLRIRKNFLFDRNLVEEAQQILKKRHKNLTEALTLYLKAVVRNPAILDEIEESASKRTGSFIGMLDGKIGKQEYKELRNESYRKGDRE
jgi:hypothetical protein